MAKKTFNSEAELISYLNDDLHSFLSDQLAPKIKQVLLKHINSDIYRKYSPNMYVRRNFLSSGLFIQSSVDGLTLVVKDMTPGDAPIGQGHRPMDNELMQIIETGAQGHGSGKWPQAFPRPATTKAQEEINKGNIVNAQLRRKYKKA